MRTIKRTNNLILCRPVLESSINGDVLDTLERLCRIGVSTYGFFSCLFKFVYIDTNLRLETHAQYVQYTWFVAYLFHPVDLSKSIFFV